MKNQHYFQLDAIQCSFGCQSQSPEVWFQIQENFRKELCIVIGKKEIRTGLEETGIPNPSSETMSNITISSELREQVRQAREAYLQLANLGTESKNQVLYAFAKALRANTSKILKANALDVVEAEKMVQSGELSESACKRVMLNEAKVELMAQNCESVAKLEDPVGKVLQATRLDEGLDLYRVSCPIGVVLVIFESRPDVVVQISALAVKSGNAVILKGGGEAVHSQPCPCGNPPSNGR